MEKRQEEIDIVAVNRNEAIFCECKWRNELTGMDVYISLVEKSKLLTRYLPQKHIIFSKSGFTKELMQHAKNNDTLELVDLDNLFNGQ